MVSQTMKYFDVDVLTWVYYVWRVGLNNVISFVFKGQLCPMSSYHDILWPMLKTTKFWALNNDAQRSFKKFLLLFHHAKMIFVLIWLFDHFALKPIPLVNGVWIITFLSYLHAWATTFKPSLMFFQLPILTSNNIIEVNFSVILFDETQRVVKTSTMGYVSVCYEIINLFVEPQNFLFVFFICKLKVFYLIVMVFDGLLMFFLHFVCELLLHL